MLPIDFYFDFASPYGFLAAMQIDALAERAGRTADGDRFCWEPFTSKSSSRRSSRARKPAGDDVGSVGRLRKI
jgi:hypothetical protein